MRLHVSQTGSAPRDFTPALLITISHVPKSQRREEADFLKSCRFMIVTAFGEGKKGGEKKADWQTSNKTSGGGSDFLHAVLTFKSTIKIRPQIASL